MTPELPETEPCLCTRRSCSDSTQGERPATVLVQRHAVGHQARVLETDLQVQSTGRVPVIVVHGGGRSHHSNAPDCTACSTRRCNSISSLGTRDANSRRNVSADSRCCCFGTSITVGHRSGLSSIKCDSEHRIRPCWRW